MTKTEIRGGARTGREIGAAHACTTNNDAPFSTHGACTAFLASQNPVVFIAEICKRADVQAAAGVTNHGQCMKALSP